MHLVHFVYFCNIAIFANAIKVVSIQYADSTSEVRFVPAGQDFELYIIAPCVIHPGKIYEWRVPFPCYNVRVSNGACVEFASSILVWKPDEETTF